ncbi:MAG: RT0821/Lpp0805 family surface protein [Alphaproteobacteria bacterium]|nr:RT0821/Lpp0805 family surface protein [Alphaproteobacteria bacterium]
MVQALRNPTLMKSTALAAVLALGLAGCAQNGAKENVGGLLGAAAGGLAGSKIGTGSGQLAAVAIGALLGGLAGQSIGRQMDENDRFKAQQAMSSATQAPIGQTITWRNPDTENSGTVTAVREGDDSQGRYCREFQQTVTIGGRTEEAYGVACRQPDGTWEIQN